MRKPTSITVKPLKLVTLALAIAALFAGSVALLALAVIVSGFKVEIEVWAPSQKSNLRRLR